MALRFFMRRLIWIPPTLVLVHFLAFGFAHTIFQIQQSQTIFGSGQAGLTPVWPEYAAYLHNVFRGDWGNMPTRMPDPLISRLSQASLASLGLLGLSFSLSLILGLSLGLLAVRVDPPRTAVGLTLAATVGLALPGFYVGILLVNGLLWSIEGSEALPILPIAGYGWDAHLVLPLLALLIRPTVQIAQVSANLLTTELRKPYIVTARSIGNTWQDIRWVKALRNMLAPVFLVAAGSFRVLVTELVLVEWLFSWPGLGKLLVQTLVPPNVSSLGGLVDTSAYFLYPPLVAALLVEFALLFLLADGVARSLALAVDPRLRIQPEKSWNA